MIHYHPRATELLYVIKGTIEVGFTDTTGTLHANTVKAGKATVRKNVLLEAGFNPKFFTHYWKAKNSNVYLFCYDYGFMKKSENDKEKYVLIQWQDYMD